MYFSFLFIYLLLVVFCASEVKLPDHRRDENENSQNINRTKQISVF